MKYFKGLFIVPAVAAMLAACSGTSASGIPDTPGPETNPEPEPEQLPVYHEITTGNLPQGHPGKVRRYSVHSAELNDDMIVDVWTPEGYDENADKYYPAIYVHDGQNLFDSSFAFAGVAWEIDSRLQQLADNGKAKAAIAVGIANRGAAGLRPSDYFPEKALNHISAEERSATKIFETCRAGFYGDEHAAFVAKELKPLVDYLYRTNPDRDCTFAMGSSMGALASLYLMCEYPDIFGGAAALSTHWIGSLDLNTDYTMNDDPVCAAAVLACFEAGLPNPAGHILYLDCGTTGWDACYRDYENSARRIAAAHGYSEQQGSLMTYDDAGAGHNEWFWQQRIDKPLTFLLRIDR